MSIFTSLIIALALWLLAWFQPAAKELVVANSYHDLSVEAKPSAVIDEASFDEGNQMGQLKKAEHKLKPIELVGVKRRIKLKAIDALWQEFQANKHWQRALVTSEFNVYVVYSNFDQAFTEADVVIGYQRDALNDAVKVIGQVPQGNRTDLLTLGQHDDSVLLDAWEKIDYQRSIQSVIEKREISGSKDLVSLHVIYQD